jgi:hypothetical protein
MHPQSHAQDFVLLAGQCTAGYARTYRTLSRRSCTASAVFLIVIDNPFFTLVDSR